MLVAVAAAGKGAQALVIGAFATFEFSVADAGNQVNVLLNVFTIAIAIGLAIPVVRNRRKDQTIKELNESIQSKDGRIRDLRDAVEERDLQKRQLEQAAAHCSQDAATWKGKYEEAKQYTAREAVEHFEEALTRHSGLVAERHAILIQQGEANAKALDRVASTLAKLEEKVS